MPDIKTRDTVKGTIRTLDKAKVAASRMKSAYIQTKDKAEHSVDAEEHNASEYATDRMESGTKRTAEETVHQTKKAAKKGADKVKDKVERKIEDRAKKKVENKAENTARDTVKNTTERASRNAAKQSAEKSARAANSAGRKSIRAVEQPASKTIKQSARSAGKSTIKTAQKGTVKTAKTSVKTAQKTSKAAIKTSKQAAKAAQKTAKATAKAAQKAAQAAKAAAKAAVKAAKAAVQLIIKIIKAIIAAIKALISAIAAGGWVAVVIILVICLIALILCSVFGVFASGEDSGTGITMRTAVEEIKQKIEDIKSSHTYDKLETSGTRAAWKEVIAVYAVWKNMADVNPANPDEPVEVATMDEGKKEDLRKLFWEMNSVESRTEKKTEKELVEVTENGKKVKKEKNVEKTYLYITTTHLDLETMMDKKSFTDDQKKMCRALLEDKNNVLWLDVLHGISGGANSDIVAVAQEQLGNVGGQPYWSWYGFSSRVEWCCCFVSWCANECGYIEDGIIPKYSVVDDGADWFKAKGLWLDGDEEPQAGMIIFFDWEYDGLDGGGDHTGIVEKVEGGRVYTIEGNSSDACQENSYPIGYYEIKGYGAPAY